MFCLRLKRTQDQRDKTRAAVRDLRLARDEGDEVPTVVLDSLNIQNPQNRCAE